MRGIWTALVSVLIAAILAAPALAGFLSDISSVIASPNLAAIQNAQRNVQSAAPENIQPKLDLIFVDLTKLPDDRLYVLNAAPDVCANAAQLDCRGVPSAAAKPFVAMALEKRKAEHSDTATRRSFYLASGGFGVSILSLCLSFAGFLRQSRRRN